MKSSDAQTYIQNDDRRHAKRRGNQSRYDDNELLETAHDDLQRWALHRETMTWHSKGYKQGKQIDCDQLRRFAQEMRYNQASDSALHAAWPPPVRKASGFPSSQQLFILLPACLRRRSCGFSREERNLEPKTPKHKGIKIILNCRHRHKRHGTKQSRVWSASAAGQNGGGLSASTLLAGANRSPISRFVHSLVTLISS